jgi:prepilin-type N-terminal cleavage/methylation domain-containing protein
MRRFKKAEDRISDCGLRIVNWGWGMGRRVRFKAKGARSIFTSSRRNCRAFTLIELIGVMAIIGILSAVLLPPLISKIEDANTTKEDANLEEIARALVAGIKATGTIPNPNVNPTSTNGWVAMATNYSVLGTNELIFSIPSSTNDTVRRYFLSPALTNFLAGNYTPPAGGWPTSNFTNGPLYLILVSVSKDGLLFGSGCTTNTNMASNNVVFLQNWAKTNNTNGRVVINNLDIVGNIAGTTDRWTNRGQFLHVKVVDLKQLFCKVNLRDIAAPPTAAVVSGTYSYPANAGAPVNGTALGYTFDFVPTLGLGNAFNGGEAGILTSSLKFRTLINRTAALTGFDVKDAGSTPAANKSTFDITLPNAPQYEINSLGIQPFPVVTLPDINSSSFYLIRGTIIKLYDGNVPTLLLNLPVTTDMNFEYFNGAWTRVD